MREARVVWSSGDAFVAHCANVVGVRWTGIPSIAQLRALREAHAAARRHGEVLLVDVVLRLDGATHVERRIYDQIVALIESCHGRTRAVAHVVEVPGPAGGFVRAFLRALERVVAGSQTRTATFDRAEAAAAWLARIEQGDDVVGRWVAIERAAASLAWAA